MQIIDFFTYLITHSLTHSLTIIISSIIIIIIIINFLIKVDKRNQFTMTVGYKQIRLDG